MQNKIPDYLDYLNAIGNPQQTLADPYLKQGKAPSKKSKGGRTVYETYSGQFALTIRFAVETKEWAIRCFTHALQPDFEERYRHVTHFVEQANTDFLVGIEFQQKGILVNGVWYPICKMEWVKGETLNEYIEGNIKQPRRMATLPEIFLELALELEELGFAHGDLQHGNIMVENRQLRLVDYDGMYLPSYNGSDMAAVETGHRHYQHPKRTHLHFDPTIDRFSAISIYLSLRALQKDISLYQTDGEALFLKQTDYADPQNSPNLDKLAELGYEDAVARLRSLCEGSVSMVPSLREFIRSDVVLLNELPQLLQKEIAQEPAIRVIDSPPPAPVRTASNVQATTPPAPTGVPLSTTQAPKPSTQPAPASGTLFTLPGDVTSPTPPAPASKPAASTPAAASTSSSTPASKPATSSRSASNPVIPQAGQLFKSLGDEDDVVSQSGSKPATNPASSQGASLGQRLGNLSGTSTTNSAASSKPQTLGARLGDLSGSSVSKPPAPPAPSAAPSSYRAPPTAAPVPSRTPATTATAAARPHPGLLRQFIFAALGAGFGLTSWYWVREGAYSSDVIGSAIEFVADLIGSGSMWLTIYVPAAVALTILYLILRRVPMALTNRRGLLLTALAGFAAFFALFLGQSPTYSDLRLFIRPNLPDLILSASIVLPAFFIRERIVWRMIASSVGGVIILGVVFGGLDSLIFMAAHLGLGVGIGAIPWIPDLLASRSPAVTARTAAFPTRINLRPLRGVFLIGLVGGVGFVGYNAWMSQAPTITSVTGSGTCDNFTWSLNVNDTNGDADYVTNQSGRGYTSLSGSGSSRNGTIRNTASCNATSGSCSAEFVAFDNRGNESSPYRASARCTVVSQPTPEPTPELEAPAITDIVTSGSCEDIEFAIYYSGSISAIEWLSSDNTVRDTHSVSSRSPYRWTNFTCDSGNCGVNFRVVGTDGQKSSVVRESFTCTHSTTATRVPVATAVPTNAPPRITDIVTSGRCDSIEFAIHFSGNVSAIEWLRDDGTVRETQSVSSSPYRWSDLSCATGSCRADFRAVGANGQKSASVRESFTCTNSPTPTTSTRTATVRSEDGSRINIRQGPGTAYSTVGQVDSGSRVTILSTRNGWNEIQYIDTENNINIKGWIHSSVF